MPCLLIFKLGSKGKLYRDGFVCVPNEPVYADEQTGDTICLECQWLECD